MSICWGWRCNPSTKAGESKDSAIVAFKNKTETSKLPETKLYAIYPVSLRNMQRGAQSGEIVLSKTKGRLSLHRLCLECISVVKTCVLMIKWSKYMLNAQSRFWEMSVSKDQGTSHWISIYGWKIQAVVCSEQLCRSGLLRVKWQWWTNCCCFENSCPSILYITLSQHLLFFFF